MEIKVCEFNKSGFCKFSEKFRKRHIEQLCETENCEELLCEKRHPKLCKYYSIYKRCKFGEYCKYNHSGNYPRDVNTLETKIENLEKTVLQNQNIIDNMSGKINELENVLKEIMKE